MSVCMYVCTYVSVCMCMYVRMYVCIHVINYVPMYVSPCINPELQGCAENITAATGGEASQVQARAC